jgi:hypothetical protein
MDVNKLFLGTTMLKAISLVKPVPSWFKDRYFKNIDTTDQAKVTIEIYQDNEQVAPWVHHSIGGQLLERKGGQVKEYEPKEVAPMRITTVDDCLTASVNEYVTGSKTPEQRAQALYAKDIRELMNSIDRREEVSISEILTQGKLTQKGKGIDEVLDFWSQDPSEKPYKKLAGTSVWSNANSNPIADLRAAQAWSLKKTGIKPNEATLGSDAAQALLDNVEFLKKLDIKNYRSAEIDIREITYGVTYLGRVIELGLDLYSYDREVKLDDQEDKVPLMPVNSVLLGSPEVPTTLVYGVTAIIDKTAGTKKFYSLPRVPFSKMEDAGRYVGIKSKPLPIVHQPQAFYVLEVL